MVALAWLARLSPASSQQSTGWAGGMATMYASSTGLSSHLQLYAASEMMPFIYPGVLARWLLIHCFWFPISVSCHIA
jgi:hypothetical protein